MRNLWLIPIVDDALGQATCENAALQQKVKELEAKLAELEPEEKAEEGAQEDQAT
jgi:BMFP domain-containing protein YqiC